MQTLQGRARPHPLTEGSAALASKSLGFNHPSKAQDRLSLVKNPVYDPQIEAFVQPKIIMTVVAMTIGLCMLWFLVVFTLYQIARFAL